jgi:restriction endonuclease Mrr
MPLDLPAPEALILALIATIILAAVYLGGRLWRRGKFQRKAAQSLGIPDLLQVTPEEFEEMVIELFQSLGHQVKRVGARENVEAYLVVKTRNGKKWIAQTKRQRGRMDDMPVRKLEKLVRYEKADRGALVITGTFAEEARHWARNNSISLYDGDEFLKAFRKLGAK